MADEALKAGIETEEDIDALLEGIRSELWEKRYADNDGYNDKSVKR